MSNSKSLTCPTCGSEHKGFKYYLSAWDSDVRLPKHFKRGKEHQTSVDNEYWYCGYCPDAWHD